MRYYLRDATAWIGRTVGATGVHPNVITVAGTLMVGVGGALIGAGHFVIAAVVLIFSLAMDAVDGAVARETGKKSTFGGVLDSSLDRYADSFILMGFAAYFAYNGQPEGVLVAFGALVGAQMVSYVRARAEGAGLECKVGLFTRFERVIVIIATLVTGWLIPGMILLALGTHFTAFQRLYRSWQEARILDAHVKDQELAE